MKTLELLGLQPDGENLTLTDSEGNRYSLRISDELHGVVRHAHTHGSAEQAVTPITPREIQAHIRAGMSLEEVSDMAALPESKVAALAHPILAEREYTARVARNYTLGREIGALSVEELVASRLLTRGVRPHEIEWDAIRGVGEPWTLIARFTSGNKQRQATWHVNMDHRTLDAIDDEANWLSEVQVPVPASPWRRTDSSAQEAAPTTASPDGAPARARIDEVLASLDAQRGKARPMPSFDEFVEEESAPLTVSVTEDADTLEEDTEVEEPVLFSVPDPTPPKKRNDRPSMPSWDEIVFGKRES